MKKVLVAYLFLLLDITLVVCAGHFGVLLPLLGVAFLSGAFVELAGENESFERCEPLLTVIVLIRVVVGALQMMGILFSTRVDTALGAGVLLGLFCMLTNGMLAAFREMEAENQLSVASCFCVIGEGCLLVMGAIVICLGSGHGAALWFFFSLACVLFWASLYQLKVIYLRFVQIL